MGRPHLIHIVPSNKWGGVQKYSLDICRYFKKEGWDVGVITRNAIAVDAPFREAGIPLNHAPLSGGSDLLTIRTLMLRLRKVPRNTPCVVHTHRYRDALAAAITRWITRRRDIRIIATRHTVAAGRLSPLFRWAYRQVDRHIFVSRIACDSFLKSLSASGFELPKERIVLLRNSLYLPQFTPSAEPTTGAVTAIYFGPIVKGKGLENLIDAFATLRKSKLRLRICGPADPDYADILRRRAMSKSVMEGIDWVIRPNIEPELCLQSHFAVFPSTDTEAFGLGNLLLMAAGRAQITSNHGAPAEYLTDELNALLIPSNDTEALARAMERLASNPELRRNMSQRARTDYSSTLSWNEFIKKLHKIYLK